MIEVWTVVGFVAQGMFFGRFFIQWIVSERKGESTVPVPVAFWFLSVLGGSMLLLYALHQRVRFLFLVRPAGLSSICAT